MTATPDLALSPARFRAQFPAMGEQIHLAGCSLGARSTAVQAALDRMVGMLDDGAGAWDAYEREAERARRGFAALIGADPSQIALVPNASTGAYQIVSTLSLAERDVIVTSEEEFPSVAHVWQAQRRRGARVRFADSFAAGFDARTALVSVPLVTFARGAVMPVGDIAEVAHRAGAPVFVDAYQAAGVLPIDVQELDCDYLVTGASKYLLGLPGIAFLYARVPTELDPVLTGWFGRVNPFAFDPRGLDFPPTARRFEIGTPAVPAVYAANAGLGLLDALDAQDVARHVAALTALCAESLTDRGEVVISPDVRGAHVALADGDPQRLAAWLAARGIRVSPRGSLLRLAFHYYNSEEDVETVCRAVERYRGSSA